MQVGIGKTSREVCDGQGLCSPGRWAPADRRYPTGSRWEPVAKLFMDFASMLGCRVRNGGPVYVNTVGTFGVAPASYYWSRVAGAIGRIAQYCTGAQAITWHLLVADDYHLEASGSEYRAALLVFFVVCDTVGIHLSWHKTSGGDVTNWVGFELPHRSHKLGVSQRWADWFARWTRTTAEQKRSTWLPSKRGSVESCMWRGVRA